MQHIENIAAPKVVDTITLRLSYKSDNFPIGNCEIAPDTASKNVTKEISNIVKFIDAEYTAHNVNNADCIVP